MPAEPPVRVRDPRGLVGRLDPSRDGRAAVGGVEERQVVRAEAEHRDAERLQQLRRRRHVEDRLHARGDDQRLRSHELTEIRGDVGRRREAAVHAAEAARSHEADPDRAAGGERAADGGRADGALDDRRRDVAGADLAGVGAEALELGLVEADAEHPVEDADVAGTAPASRTRRSLSRPTATPSPGGKPWATSVVSSATTACRSASARPTSSDTRRTSFTASTLASRRSEPPRRGRAPARRRGSPPRARRRRPSSRPPLPATPGARRRRSSLRAARA